MQGWHDQLGCAWGFRFLLVCLAQNVLGIGNGYPVAVVRVQDRIHRLSEGIFAFCIIQLSCRALFGKRLSGKFALRGGYCGLLNRHGSHSVASLLRRVRVYNPSLRLIGGKGQGLERSVPGKEAGKFQSRSGGIGCTRTYSPINYPVLRKRFLL